MRSPFSTRLLNICLSSLCKSRRLDVAEQTLTDGIRLGYIPDVVTYNTLISAYCNLLGVDHAYSVLSRMRELGLKADVITYNSLIAGEVKRRSLPKTLDLFQEMIRSGVRPDLWTYNNLLHCLFKSGHPDLASRVLNAMESADLAPCSTTYNILLHGLCCSGDSDGALDLFRRLVTAPGNPRSIIPYNILIHGLSNCGKVREARALFRELAQSGILPNSVTYTIMMKSYFNSRRFKEGFRILDEIYRRGYHLDPFVYCTAIGALIKIGKLEEASEFLEEMNRQCSRDLDIVFINNRINLCFKQGKVVEALDFLDQVEEIDDYTISILIDGLCKNDRIGDASRLLRYVGSRSNPVPLNCFIRGLCMARGKENLDLAMDLFQVLEKKDSFAYAALLRGLVRTGRFLEAVMVMAAGLREGVKLPRSLRRLVLAGLRSKRFKTHAKKLRWEIVKAKFRLP